MTKKKSNQIEVDSQTFPTNISPNLKQQIKSVEYLEKYAETKDIKHLRMAIKKNPEVFFLEERMRDWIFEISYKSSIPHPTKEYKDAREFMEDLRLLKPEKHGEILIFFGSGYRLESCLGIKFVANSKPQLISFDDAAMIYFVNELKQLWKDFRKKQHKYKFKSDSDKKTTILDMCFKELGLNLTEDDLGWGSIHYATDIAITILGIANKNRFQLLFLKYPNHELKKYIQSYFSFHTLLNLYKKTKKTVSRHDIEVVSSKLQSAKNENNPFKIDYSAGTPTHVFLARELDTYFIIEEDGRSRKPTHVEKIKHLEKLLHSRNQA